MCEKYVKTMPSNDFNNKITEKKKFLNGNILQLKIPIFWLQLISFFS